MAIAKHLAASPPRIRKRKLVEAEDGESGGYIEWYVPEGFAVQEKPPTSAELAFVSGVSAAGDALVGRRMLFHWEGVGWCEGVIQERNRDSRYRISKELGADKVNFRVYYAQDDNLSKHVLESGHYRFGPEAPVGSWVFLNEIDS